MVNMVTMVSMVNVARKGTVLFAVIETELLRKEQVAVRMQQSFKRHLQQQCWR